MDSNQILHTNKDQQICFVGGPEMQKKNSRWQTAAILKNRKSANISGTFDQF